MAEEAEEKPERRRRRRAAADAPEAAAENALRDETAVEDEAARSASAADASAGSASEGQELEATPSDEEAEEAAADVVLEADAEAEGESRLPDSAQEDVEAPAEEDVEAPAEGDVEARAEEDVEAPAEEAGPSRRSGRRRGAAAPARPVPTRRRRSARDPDLPPPVVRAQARYVRSSARKARLVCDHIRGKTVEEARAILAHTPRAIAREWSKLLESAVANAENNHDLVGEDLYVKAVHADEGPTIKRFRPRALGRATRIRKRTSHLTILLTPKE